jgi:hypothetical protein
MEISTKWNYHSKAPSSYIVVHTSDDPTVEARYLEFADDYKSVDGKVGFYSVDVRTRGGSITLYLDHEHIDGLMENLQSAQAKRTEAIEKLNDAELAMAQS